MGRALVSVARTNTVRGSLAMAGTAVVIAAKLKLHWGSEIGGSGRSGAG